MQLEKVTCVLQLAHKAGLDGVDLMVLAAIAATHARGEDATIMRLSLGKGVVSFGTVHARVQRLVRKGYLSKKVSSVNQRYKLLEQTPKLHKFLESITTLT